jgi:hypothetical protein
MSEFYINIHEDKIYHYGQDNDISIQTVAYQLARLPRFAGASAFPYTVGQHSLNVVRLLTYFNASIEARLSGLVHDAHEILLGDIPTPFQHWFAQRFSKGEDLLEQAKTALDADILPSLGVPYPFSKSVSTLVHYADKTAFLAEANVVFKNRPQWLDSYMSASWVNIIHVERLMPHIHQEAAELVEQTFIETYENLQNEYTSSKASKVG